jgi:tetratricopeptide (TPR) repeat protein
VGGEYVFRNVLFLRAGFRLGYDLNFATVGAGIRYRFGLVDAAVDYVHLPYRYFGPINNFSVDTKFESLKDSSPALSDNKQKLLELYYFRGLTYFGQNDFDQALAEWQKALDLDPGNKVIEKAVRDAKDRRIRLKNLRQQTNAPVNSGPGNVDE